jgi:hypothetical protein
LHPKGFTHAWLKFFTLFPARSLQNSPSTKIYPLEASETSLLGSFPKQPVLGREFFP